MSYEETTRRLENPINKILMIDSPKDWKEVHDYIETFSGEDKAVATVIAGMVWNLAHQQVENFIEAQNK